jgi:four helix bundle protein
LSDTYSKVEFRKRLYRYVVKVIKFVTVIPSGCAEEVIKRQVIRSSSSIGANYFESLAASSKRDFINYFTHALKSANETKFWLSLLKDTNLIGSHLHSDIDELMQETREIANILASSILTMKGKRNRIRNQQ